MSAASERGRGRGSGRHRVAYASDQQRSAGDDAASLQHQQIGPGRRRRRAHRGRAQNQPSIPSASNATLLFSYQHAQQGDGPAPSILDATVEQTQVQGSACRSRGPLHRNQEEDIEGNGGSGASKRDTSAGAIPKTVRSWRLEASTLGQDTLEPGRLNNTERTTPLLPTYEQLILRTADSDGIGMHSGPLRAFNEHLRSCLTGATASIGFFCLKERRLVPGRGLGWALEPQPQVSSGRVILLKDTEKRQIYYGEVVRHNKEVLAVLYNSELAMNCASKLEGADAGMSASFFWALTTALSEQPVRAHFDILSGYTAAVPASSIFSHQIPLHFESLGHSGCYWPDDVNTLDERQYGALRSAITNAITTVHAPPGSGATRLASCIVRMLLDNLPVWYGKKQPALIVTEDVSPFSACVSGLQVFTLGKHLVVVQHPNSVRETATATPDVVHAKRKVDEALARVVNIASVLMASELRVLHQDELKDFTRSFSDRLGQERNYVRDWLFYGMIPEEVEHVANAEAMNYDAECKRYQDVLKHDENSNKKFGKRMVQGRMKFQRGHFLQNVYMKNIYVWKKLRNTQNECLPDLAHVKSIYSLDVVDKWILYNLWVSRFRSSNHRQLCMAQEQVTRESQVYNRVSKESTTTQVVGKPVVVVSPHAAVEHRFLLQALCPRILMVLGAQRVGDFLLPGIMFPSIEQAVLIGNNFDAAQVNGSLWHRVHHGGSTTGHYELNMQYVLPQNICTVLSACTGERMVSRITTNLSLRGVKEYIRIFNIKQRDTALLMLVQLAAHFVSHGYGNSSLAVLTLDSSRDTVHHVQSVLDARGIDIRAASIRSWYPRCAVIILIYASAKSSGKMFAAAISRSLCAVYAFGDVPPEDEEFQNIVNASRHISLGPLTLECIRHPGKPVFISSPRDFTTKSNDNGSCRERCGKPLRCGHTCPNKCHVGAHTERCKEQVSVTLSCGHSGMVRCSDAALYAAADPLRRLNSSLHLPPCNVMVRATLPNCEHLAEFPCFSRDRDRLTYQCIERVSTLSCGHSASILCHEQKIFLCQQRVTKTLPCGHRVTRTCCNTSMCTLEVEKELPCGHTVLLECWMATSNYWKSKSCNVRVRTKLPDCEHHVEFPCSSVSTDRLNYQCRELGATLDCGHKAEVVCCMRKMFRCQEILEKRMPCGHLVRRGCSWRDSPCTERVERTLACGHSLWVDCNTDIRGVLRSAVAENGTCRERCGKPLRCGHTCPNKCHVGAHTERCKEQVSVTLSCGHSGMVRCSDAALYAAADPLRRLNSSLHLPPCNVMVRATLPNCEHLAEFPCFSRDRDRLTYQCIERVSTLSCGHSASILCHEQKIFLCQQRVTKTLPCGHRVTRTCCNTSMCTLEVEKELPCGHTVLLECWMATSNYWKSKSCNVRVRTKLPDCEHHVEFPCSSVSTDRLNYQCRELGATLDCGHKAEVVCCMRKMFRCQEILEKRMPCGHLVRRGCSWRDSPCTERVERTLACGHSLWVDCNTDIRGVLRSAVAENGTCRERCGKTLRCGHTCPNRCHTGAHIERCKEVSVTLSCGHSRMVCCSDAALYAAANPLRRLNSSLHLPPCNVMVRATLPNCEHLAEFPCFSRDRDRLTYQCIECVSTLSCGHSASILCHEQKIFLCQQRVTKTLPCGHRVTRTCCNTSMCTLEVEKELPCGHTVLLECWMATSNYWKSKSCNVRVRTKLPDCEHHVEFPCSSVSTDRLNYQCRELGATLDCGHKAEVVCCMRKMFRCQEILEKRMPCGHLVRRGCSWRDSPCTERVERTLACGHSLWVDCNTDIRGVLRSAVAENGTCRERCGKTLRCGHTCPNRCHTGAHIERCKEEVSVTLSCGHSRMVCCSDAALYAAADPLRRLKRSLRLPPCNVMVRATLPNCEHHAEFPCFSRDRDRLTYQCIERVSTLSCGHSASILCHEQKRFLCQQRVTKTLPCGHHVTRTCCDTSMCTLEVEKELPCGHTVLLECWMATSNYWKSKSCNVRVRTKLPDCEHHVEFPCSSVSTDRLNYQCRELGATLDCGHKAEVVCCMRKMFRCQEILEKRMPCGHLVRRGCSWRDSPCTERVERTLACGHSLWVDCSTDFRDTLCSVVVAERLECGHTASRMCLDSSSCQMQCSNVVAKCGHRCTLPCAHNRVHPLHECQKCKDKCLIS
ncbi:uncharacterized protein LOC135394653 [Ornithodoros turicata]|uniref:uncharacterized protein LOC135394653 n=1 Tax=Ornithodoros turicata TaxID=34597 RepID=UPI00313968AD